MTRLTTRRRSRTSTEEDAKTAAARAPFISRKLDTFSVLSSEGLELIEHNADTILRETGMEFHGDPEILDVFRNAGCDVQDTRVRFEPGFCRSTIQATAPRQFNQHARNPANSVQLGGNATVLCPSWGPPFVHDLDRGRRYASHADFVELVKLHQSLPWLHHSGG
ncbi:trimethylamine methyltransferase family protein, partial [Aestuariivirga sp.]|uniref:trimethylamine methyltransferase family protein n=1 Tax=Aestuariivirga sp. TaxID=2650926 RepID=UPI0035B0CA17